MQYMVLIKSENRGKLLARSNTCKIPKGYIYDQDNWNAKSAL